MNTRFYLRNCNALTPCPYPFLAQAAPLHPAAFAASFRFLFLEHSVIMAGVIGLYFIATGLPMLNQGWKLRFALSNLSSFTPAGLPFASAVSAGARTGFGPVLCWDCSTLGSDQTPAPRGVRPSVAAGKITSALMNQIPDAEAESPGAPYYTRYRAGL